MIHDQKQTNALYWASGIVSICGIIFEVLFGAAGSYLLGDGVKQYTLTISLFLTGMGIGSALSEKVTKNLLLSFVYVEYLIGLLGGFSIFVLFGVTAFFSSGTDAFFLYTMTLLVGGLTGIELPILIRKANEIGETLSRSTARVLFSDYSGGLIGGLLFVYILRPSFGLVKTSLLIATVNVAVALWVLWYFRKQFKRLKIHATVGAGLFITLFSGLFWAEEVAFTFEQKLYRDPIIHQEQTAYQSIILTKEQQDLRLFLDGQLQFSSSDEYRYHEMLVHTPLSAVNDPKSILVLGGGDGLAIRELQKYSTIQEITLVDLDPAVVNMAKNNHHLLALNENAFAGEKVKVVHEDAFTFLKEESQFYDVIIIDLPDPNNESLNKLYTLEFYQLVRNHLTPEGVMMMQATSPTFSKEVYWTIEATVKETGMVTKTMHIDVPSFGDWGFILAGKTPIEMRDLNDDIALRYLTDEVILSSQTFSKDIARESLEEQPKVNTLIRPIIIELYEKAWRAY
ncbi:polyamine aminopropyltransferase [Mangrovibacillus cuniculi]|uniref:Polyamine aminopropyltransferase n=1 Tax=Mangrovibacillus cuniculi TaxID=2593652 RepID=A0A7S8CD64_9BACI|nr:polyamine aminopropyltransferase [Mangrovibacillus cuniculi]QPC47800.1 polyamine aminopropyltransferase [Mangrovibacillus cuniculi]